MAVLQLVAKNETLLRFFALRVFVYFRSGTNRDLDEIQLPAALPLLPGCCRLCLRLLNKVQKMLLYFAGHCVFSNSLLGLCYGGTVSLRRLRRYAHENGRRGAP